jgi:hypothetical protein
LIDIGQLDADLPCRGRFQDWQAPHQIDPVVTGRLLRQAQGGRLPPLGRLIPDFAEIRLRLVVTAAGQHCHDANLQSLDGISLLLGELAIEVDQLGEQLGIELLRQFIESTQGRVGPLIALREHQP